MNAKTQQRERSHDTILASAARLLRERGLAGAKVADVMRGAGLTVGGFYAHFESKEALLREVLRRASLELRTSLFAHLDEKPAADRVEVVLKRYLSARHRDETVRGCPLPAVVGEVGTTAPEYAVVVEEQVAAMVEALQCEVPEHDGLSKRTVAIGLIALMYGGLSLSRAVVGTPLSDEILKACRALGTHAARRGPSVTAVTPDGSSALPS